MSYPFLTLERNDYEYRRPVIIYGLIPVWAILMARLSYIIHRMTETDIFTYEILHNLGTKFLTRLSGLEIIILPTTNQRIIFLCTPFKVKENISSTCLI